MPEKLDQFLEDVAQSKAKCETANAELIAKLKCLSAKQFVRVKRDVVNALTLAQYADVVKTVAPDIKLQTEKRPPEPSKSRARKPWWLAIPVPVVAIAMGLSVGLITLGAACLAPWVLDWWSYDKPLVRSHNFSEWPRCPGLTYWTDGCVYHVTNGLAWPEVARDLNLPVGFLHLINDKLNDDFIRADSDVIVWRQRFPLLEDR